MTERDLFLAALEIADPTDRAAYLDRECAGDLGLRDRVVSLFGAYEASGAFMDRPAAGGTLTGPGSPAALVGTRIGPYKLLQVIGEGGFGIVYMAEQDRPVSRRVALKVIKPGMDSAAVLARFEAERQALAMMDHPNIARVLDAGATDSGHPYFVMDLVKGVPITEFCDTNKMPPAARLELFAAVCRAVQHAHQKGIIHRDLKPSNILVTLHDGVPVPKVIDFGVAKATAQKLTERTLFTAYGQMVGTPAYMSPEQAEMSGLDIDTRSDIYSLGVLLYELLTGTTPIVSDRLRTIGYAELQRLIRDEETPRPSNRVSTLGDSATVMASHRGMDARQLSRQLAGDIDWIVLKALAKDRNHRYETPGEFAADIGRYLRREAILARPPSAGYRLRKFARRNRGPLVAAGLVFLALVVGLFGTTWGMVQADEHRREAEGNERKAVDAAAAEKEARHTIEAREAAGRAILAFLEKRILAAAAPKGYEGGLGRDATLREALVAAMPYLDEGFPDDPIIEARLRTMLGASFTLLGEPKTALEQFEKARTLYTTHLGPSDLDTLRAVNNLAVCYGHLDRHADALKLKEEALPPFKEALGPNDPEVLQAMSNLAATYDACGRYDEALKLNLETLKARQAVLGDTHRDTHVSMYNLSNTYAALGDNDKALELRQKVLPLIKVSLTPEHPETLTVMSNLAHSLDAAGKHKDALDLHEEVFKLRTKVLSATHGDTLRSRTSLAFSYCRFERFAEALRHFEETLARRKKWPGPDHPDTLLSMWGMAMCLVHLDRGAESVPVIDECIKRSAGQPVDGNLVPAVMRLRLKYFKKAQDPAGCRETAEKWEGLSRTDPDSLVLAAKIRVVAAAIQRAKDATPAAAARADTDAGRAVEWLRKAVAAGWTELKSLANDKDFDLLRGRADYQALVAGKK